MNNKIIPLNINSNYGVDKEGNIYTRIRQASLKGHQGFKTIQAGAWSLIRGTLTGKGYIQVEISGKSYRVNRLIALTFLPNPTNYPEVHHKNGLRTDNRVENLEWGDAKSNAADRSRHGNTLRGSRNPNSKLDEEKVRAIRLQREHKSLNQLAKEFGVSKKLILLVVQNRIWKEVII